MRRENAAALMRQVAVANHLTSRIICVSLLIRIDSLFPWCYGSDKARGRAANGLLHYLL